MVCILLKFVLFVFQCEKSIQVHLCNYFHFVVHGKILECNNYIILRNSDIRNIKWYLKLFKLLSGNYQRGPGIFKEQQLYNKLEEDNVNSESQTICVSSVKCHEVHNGLMR